MNSLITSAKQLLQQKDSLPFAVYSSVREQHIFNVPIVKPLLICVLKGSKTIGSQQPISCDAGQFIFLSGSPDVDMRNIPGNEEYCALLIEFEFSDFACFPVSKKKSGAFLQGTLDSALQKTLLQFVEWSAFAPAAMWSLRRQEILQLIDYSGYPQIREIAEPAGLSHKLHSLISRDINKNWQAADFASAFAMSESTLRRKLMAEATTVQAIKDKARLAYGLHLVQSSTVPVSQIAAQCGYQSQSRFTDKFRQFFGITPSSLRKTQMHDLGE